MSVEFDEQLYYSLKARVKSASRAMMSEPDWAANIEIVDLCNERPDYIPYVAKVLQKRIRHWDPNVGVLALSIVEALVKNCPKYHPYVITTAFLDSLLKELYRKKDKKTILQHMQIQQQNVSETVRLQRRDKILLMVESFSRSADVSKTFEIYRITYNDLVRQGFSFPVPLKDEISPVFTPAAKPRIRPDTDVSGPVKDYVLQKYLSTVELFMDTINETQANEDIDKNEAVKSLKASLEESQTDVLNKISLSDASDELMAELLIVNDEICQALGFHKKIASGKLKPKKHKGDKKQRAKGQRVSVQPAFMDVLGVLSDKASGANSESEEDSEDEKDKPSKVLQHKGSEEVQTRELVLAAKGLAAPRSNAKVRAPASAKAITNESSEDFWAKSPINERNDPFDSFQSTKELGNSPSKQEKQMSAADSLLSSLVIAPSKKVSAQQQNMNIYDPL